MSEFNINKEAYEPVVLVEYAKIIRNRTLIVIENLTEDIEDIAFQIKDNNEFNYNDKSWEAKAKRALKHKAKLRMKLIRSVKHRGKLISLRAKRMELDLEKALKKGLVIIKVGEYQSLRVSEASLDAVKSRLKAEIGTDEFAVFAEANLRDIQSKSKEETLQMIDNRIKRERKSIYSNNQKK